MRRLLGQACAIVLGVSAACGGSDGKDDHHLTDRGASYNLSQCATELSARYAGLGVTPLYRWYSAARQDARITANPAWAGCESDERSGADGFSGDYEMTDVLGLVYRADRPPPVDTVPLYEIRRDRTGGLAPDYYLTTSKYGAGTRLGIVGYVVPFEQRNNSTTQATLDVLAMHYAYDNTDSDAMIGVGTNFAAEAFVLKQDSVSTLREGECNTHEQCGTYELCVPATPGPGRCERRCFSNLDCDQDQRCDLESQRCRIPLVHYEGAESRFLRASEGSYLTGASTLSWAQRNELRWEDRGEGAGPQPLIEAARRNDVPFSEDIFKNVPLHALSTDTQDVGLAVGPDDADGVVVSGHNFAFPQGEASTARTYSLWMRAGLLDSPKPSWTMGNQRTAFTPLADWSRIDALGYGQIFGVDLGAVGTTADLRVFGLQSELGLMPSSYIRTRGVATTRAADDLTFVPLTNEMTAEGFMIDVWPAFSWDDLGNGLSKVPLLQFGTPVGNTNDGQLKQNGFLYLSYDGGDDDEWVGLELGGVDLGMAPVYYFGRHSHMRIVVWWRGRTLEVRQDGKKMTGALHLTEAQVNTIRSSTLWKVGDGSSFLGRISEPMPLEVKPYCSSTPSCPPQTACQEKTCNWQANNLTAYGVAVGPNNIPWAINNGSQPVHLVGGSWTTTPVPGTVFKYAYDITVDSNNVPWLVTNTGVAKLNGTAWQAVALPTGVSASHIRAAGGNLYITGYANGVSSVYRYTGTTWTVVVALPAGANYLAVQPDGTLWTGSWNFYARYKNNMWETTQSGVTALAAGPDGSVWRTTTNYDPSTGFYYLERMVNGTFEPYPGVGTGLSIGPDGTVWALGPGWQLQSSPINQFW